MSDLRLWIANCRLYTYPDVMVVHTPLVFAENRQDTIVSPLMIAEILSDSTEKYAPQSGSLRERFTRSS